MKWFRNIFNPLKSLSLTAAFPSKAFVWVQQGIGNTSQGAANCIMFVLLTRPIRTRLCAALCCCSKSPVGEQPSHGAPHRLLPGQDTSTQREEDSGSRVGTDRWRCVDEKTGKGGGRDGALCFTFNLMTESGCREGWRFCRRMHICVTRKVTCLHFGWWGGYCLALHQHLMKEFECRMLNMLHVNAAASQMCCTSNFKRTLHFKLWTCTCFLIAFWTAVHSAKERSAAVWTVLTQLHSGVITFILLEWVFKYSIYGYYPQFGICVHVRVDYLWLISSTLVNDVCFEMVQRIFMK